MASIITDTGWTHSSGGRYITLSRRTVTFDTAPTVLEINAGWGEAAPRGQFEQADQAETDLCTVNYYVYCDSTG